VVFEGFSWGWSFKLLCPDNCTDLYSFNHLRTELAPYLSRVSVSVGKGIELYFIYQEGFMLKMNFSLNKTHNPLTISERFLLIRKEFSLTAGRLGEIAGVTGTAIAKIESGETVNPKADILSRISTKLQINLNWLLLGEGDMLKLGISSKTSDIHYQPTEGDTVPRDGSGVILFIEEPETHLHPATQKALLKKHDVTQPYPADQNNAHAVGLLSDIPIIELRRVSFKARASFNYAQLQRYKDSDIFDTVLFRLPPGRTAEDYADALVFDIEGDSMEPSLRDGQQVIAWPVSDGKWEYLHNTICVVDYDETVTVKAIFKNELFDRDGLTLHATGGAGGSFTVARKDIHSIWEVREFYGVVPVRLLP